MTKFTIHKILTCAIAAIWLINGFFCKVLNLVPRHQQIVASILQINHSRLITIVIGILESFMAFWIVSGFKSRLNAIVQIVIIGTMNGLEFFLAPNLLLWGRGNAIFAIILMVAVFYNEFYLNRKLDQQT